MNCRRALTLFCAAIVTTGLATALQHSGPAAAASSAPPAGCGSATLLGGASPKPYTDGSFAPVLLVHGWTGEPDMWLKSIDGTTLPVPVSGSVKKTSLASNLQKLTGAAVYTLDYQKVAAKWFTQRDAGGHIFLEAEKCLLASEAFADHKLTVVAHSMGGLITRWAANTDSGLAKRLGLVVTLGTPYTGSWLATVGALLMDGVQVATSVGAALDRRIASLLGVVHLIVLTCSAHKSTPGCSQLNDLLDLFNSVQGFAIGSGPIRDLKGWPPGIRVDTLVGDIELEDISAGLFGVVPAGATLSLGDGVVDVDSATSGSKQRRVATCRYTASALRAGVDGVLGPLTADTDKRSFMPLPAAVFGPFTTCGHMREAQLIQLTNEALGAVNEELASYERTKVVDLAPVDTQGNPVPGYTVVDEPGAIDCTSASPVAVNKDIYYCGTTADSTDVCWPDASLSLLCLRDPWKPALVRKELGAAPAKVSPLKSPRPFGVELDDGTHCRIRNGGAWPSQQQHPTYVGFYSCGPTGRLVVWAASGDGINRTSGKWTVQVGTATGPLAVRSVIKAYFAATAPASTTSRPSPPPTGTKPATSQELIALVNGGMPTETQRYHYGSWVYPGGGPLVRMDSIQFHTHGGNIKCYLLSSLLCNLDHHNFADPPRPATCGPSIGWHTSVVSLDPAGAHKGRCSGELDYPPGSNELPYGSTLRFSGYGCYSSAPGVACVNFGSGRGFYLNRDSFTAY